MVSDTRYDGGNETVSLESRFVEHFLYALDRLQSCWINDDKFHPKQFNLQLLYMIRLLPDRKKQNAILRNWNAAQADAKTLMPNLADDELQSYAGMEVVTELILFICNTFELLNTDITGPATAKEYQDAIITMKEMDEFDTPEES